jgi:integrase
LEVVSHLRAAVVAMGAADKAVGDVGKRDLQALLRATADMPGAARHRSGASGRFFDWAIDEGHIAANPCGAIAKARRPKAVASRQDHLTPSQLVQLWRAAGEIEGFDAAHRDFVRLLIAVPCRRTEAGRMDWQHLDPEAAVWTQPAKRTKIGDPHRLHLHPVALELLRARNEVAGKPKDGLVLPDGGTGSAITTFSAIKTAVDEQARIEGWVFHDLRRSFATVLGESGQAARRSWTRC